MPKRAKPKASEALKKSESLKSDAAEAKRAAAKLERQAIQRLGRLALQAGLADVQIKDKELTAGLSDLAARFH